MIFNDQINKIISQSGVLGSKNGVFTEEKTDKETNKYNFHTFN